MKLPPELAQELEDALRNMMGAFDTPLARRFLPGEFAEEARETGRKVIEKIDNLRREQGLKPCTCQGFYQPLNCPRHSKG